MGHLHPDQPIGIEAGVLPGEVEVPGEAIDRDVRQFAGVAHRHAQLQIHGDGGEEGVHHRVGVLPMLALIARAEDRLLQGELEGRLIEEDAEEGVPQGAVRQDHDLGALAEEDKLRRHGDLLVVDRDGGPPALAAVRGAAEHYGGGADVPEQGPGRVDQVGVEGIGGQRILVVEQRREERVLGRRPGDEDRLRPGDAAVVREGRGHAVLADGVVEYQRHVVGPAVRAEADPGVRAALEPSRGPGQPAEAAGKGDHDLGPAPPAVERVGSAHGLAAAVAPAVHVPGGDHVVEIGGVDRDIGFGLAVAVDQAALGPAVAGGDRHRVIRIAAVGRQTEPADRHGLVLRRRRSRRRRQHRKAECRHETHE